MEEKIFNLFASCIPVKGKNKSIICDVYRGRFRYIPHALYYILTHFKGHTINEIKEKTGHAHDQFIDDYFKFLEENEFIFYCLKEEQKMFPKLNLEFEFPSVISNCIMDFDDQSNYDVRTIFSQLTELHCRFLQLRFFSSLHLDEVIAICRLARNTSLTSIHLVIPYHSSVTKDKIAELYEAVPVSQLDFYRVPANEIAHWKKLSVKLPFHFHEVQTINEKHCGRTGSENFSINMNTFSEAKKFNSCLNKKLSIDTKGVIKNCPSMSAGHGNVKDTLLHEAINKKGFKDLWNITKDKISVCRDCEFRYICIDCRAYLEDPADLYSKPLKCGYDPYTNKWEDWSKNPLKQKAISYYEMEELFTNTQNEA